MQPRELVSFVALVAACSSTSTGRDKDAGLDELAHGIGDVGAEPAAAHAIGEIVDTDVASVAIYAVRFCEPSPYTDAGAPLGVSAYVRNTTEAPLFVSPADARLVELDGRETAPVWGNSPDCLPRFEGVELSPNEVTSAWLTFEPGHALVEPRLRLLGVLFELGEPR